MAAEVTDSIRLAVGVLPLDRQRPARIAARVAELGLPNDRLTLGVGSGGATRGLELVRSGMLELRSLTDAAIAVGALGPRMCRLGGEIADGVVLNWLTTVHAPTSIADVERGVAAAGRPRPWVAGYVRTAMGEVAIGRLREEADAYANYPSYAGHFARMRAAPLDTTVRGASAEEIQGGLEAFDAVLDETVVRAVPATETAESYLAILEAAAPRRDLRRRSLRPKIWRKGGSAMTEERSTGESMPMEPTSEAGSQERLEQTPQAGEGTDDDEATTTAGPGQGGSSGRTGEGPTAEIEDTPMTPTTETGESAMTPTGER